MTKQDRIACLLARGMPATQVASLVAVHPSYISQLNADPDFKAHVAELVQELAEAEGQSTEQEERTYYRDKLAAAEHKILDHILAHITHSSAREAASILDTVGKRRDVMDGRATISALHAQQTIQGPNGSTTTTTRVVQLTMPNVCVPELRMAGNNEIVSIGDRSTAPMPAQALRSLLGAEDPTTDGGYTYEHANA